jgi:hypothetical protein
VDARRDPIANRIIHKPVAGEAVFALEGRGDDQDVEMPPSGLGSLMAMMLGTIIANRNGIDRKRSA